MPISDWRWQSDGELQSYGEVSKMNQSESLISECKEMVVHKNVSKADIVAYLHEQGVSIIESMKVVRVVFDLSLAQSKELVVSHPDWEILVRNSEPLHEDLIKAFNEEMKT
jgi:hypothetical protein